MAPTPKRHSSGFTLIEMMLAIGVLALILTMLASSFSVVSHSKVHGEARLGVDREGRALLWQLSNEIRGAVQTPQAPSNVLLVGQGRVGSNGPIDTLTLSTLQAGHRRALTNGGPETVVSYDVVNNPDHSGWYLLQREQQTALMPAGRGDQSLILADNVLSINFRYFDGQRWVEVWDSTRAPAGRQLPVAVVIAVTLAAPGGRAMNFATQVTVPMAITTW